METLHGIEVQDPFRWLEHEDSAETRAWVAAQNGYTRGVLDRLAGREALGARLDERLAIGWVGTPTVRGDRYFYQRRDGRRDQPVLMLRTGAAGPERVLLDPNTLGSGGTVALDWWYPSHDGALVAYGVSQGGDELSTLHILDAATGAQLAEEPIPHTRACSLAWLPDASGFYYTRYPIPGTVPSGDETYHRHVFFHALGTGWRDDPELAGGDRAKEDWPSVQLSRDGRWLVVAYEQGWTRTELFLSDRHDAAHRWLPILAGVEARAEAVFADDRLFLLTDLAAPRQRLVEVDPRRPEPDAWRDVLPEPADRVLNSVRPVAGLLVVEELVAASSRLRVCRVDGAEVRSVELPDLGTVTGLGGEWAGAGLVFGFTSFDTPPTVYHCNPASGPPTVFAAVAGTERRPAAAVVRQVWYPSVDGTWISMFLVHRPGVSATGQNPTVLTGYGGFNVSRTPSFEPALGPFLDAGGVYALPNLRGGGEYGEPWHRAGMLAHKQNVFDDFRCAAEWLIANRYTSPERLAITGGSNGGLLVGAAVTQWPELFKAVVCRVPLLDMLRYHTFRLARLWMPEYGSAEDPEQFAWLHAYSPYHRVRSDARYPAVFLLTAEGDSRVDPMHARKMAARLQAAVSDLGDGGPVLLRVETGAGHGVGKPRGKMLDEATDVWAFLFWQLGMTAVV